MIEIKDVRLLLPAMVKYKQEDGQESSIFVYIDQLNRNIIIPDDSGIDVEDFKAQFSKFYGNKKQVVPELPKNIDRTRYEFQYENDSDLHAKDS